MTEEGGLYGLVQHRLVQARALLADLDASAEVRAAVERRLRDVEAEAQFALTDAPPWIRCTRASAYSREIRYSRVQP